MRRVAVRGQVRKELLVREGRIRKLAGMFPQPALWEAGRVGVGAAVPDGGPARDRHGGNGVRAVRAKRNLGFRSVRVGLWFPGREPCDSSCTEWS